MAVKLGPPMAVRAVEPGVFFGPRSELPRGRHALAPEAARTIQCERLMTAFAELVADRGLDAVRVADIVGRAEVSRASFYSCFTDLAACGEATYDRFIAVLLERVGSGLDLTGPWHDFIRSAVSGYLGTLQQDRVVARAMQLEMDAAGRIARLRRHRALSQFADLIAARHMQLRSENPQIGALPHEAFLGTVYAVRQLACDRLENDPDADLMELLEPCVQWIAAAVDGAADPAVAERPHR